MTKVKVFVYGRRRRRGYDNSSPDFRHGELKMVILIWEDLMLLIYKEIVNKQAQSCINVCPFKVLITHAWRRQHGLGH